MKICAFLAFFSVTISAKFAAAGIAGQVTLKGEPLYPDVPVEGMSDKHCLTHGGIKTEDWKISPGKGLGDVVVSIENPPKTVAQGGAKKIAILQEGCRYQPHVSAMQSGGIATIKNGDNTLHNVRGMIYLGKGKAAKPLFNVGQPIKGMSMDQTFSAPGIYRLNCDVHPWMESWILIFAHPFFGVTDLDGKFQLPDGLPDGEYTIKAWHSRFKTPITQTVSVQAGKAEVNLSFDASVSQ